MWNHYRQPTIMTIMAATIPADIPEPLTTLKRITHSTDAICNGSNCLVLGASIACSAGWHVHTGSK